MTLNKTDYTDEDGMPRGEQLNSNFGVYHNKKQGNLNTWENMKYYGE